MTRGASSDTLSPFPSIAGGFASFSKASMPPRAPKYIPETAAPLPSDGSAAIESSTSLLARAVRGFSSTTPVQKKRRSAVKAKHFVPRTRERKRSEPVEQIGEEELEAELKAEEKDEVTPVTARRVITRSRGQTATERKTWAFGMRKRARSESDGDAADEEEQSEENNDRSSDEDFM